MFDVSVNRLLTVGFPISGSDHSWQHRAGDEGAGQRRRWRDQLQRVLSLRVFGSQRLLPKQERQGWQEEGQRLEPSPFRV